MLALPTPGATRAGLAGQDWLLQPLSDRDRQALLGAAGRCTRPSRWTAASSTWPSSWPMRCTSSTTRWAWAPCPGRPGTRWCWTRAGPRPWTSSRPAGTGPVRRPGPARRQAMGALVNALLISVEIEADPALDEPCCTTAPSGSPGPGPGGQPAGPGGPGLGAGAAGGGGADEARQALQQLWSSPGPSRTCWACPRTGRSLRTSGRACCATGWPG
jgi:hypothetical protein